MARAKPPRSGDDKHRRRGHDGEEYERREQEEPYNNPGGRDREVFEEIARRRFEGGAPPTFEAYDRGVEEWSALPGAVTRDPATVKAPQAAPAESAETVDDEVEEWSALPGAVMRDPATIKAPQAALAESAETVGDEEEEP